MNASDRQSFFTDNRALTDEHPVSRAVLKDFIQVAVTAAPRKKDYSYARADFIVLVNQYFTDHLNKEQTLRGASKKVQDLLREGYITYEDGPDRFFITSRSFTVLGQSMVDGSTPTPSVSKRAMLPYDMLELGVELTTKPVDTPPSRASGPLPPAKTKHTVHVPSKTLLDQTMKDIAAAPPGSTVQLPQGVSLAEVANAIKPLQEKPASAADATIEHKALLRVCDICGAISAINLRPTAKDVDEMKLPGETVKIVHHDEAIGASKSPGLTNCVCGMQFTYSGADLKRAFKRVFPSMNTDTFLHTFIKALRE